MFLIKYLKNKQKTNFFFFQVLNVALQLVLLINDGTNCTRELFKKEKNNT